MRRMFNALVSTRPGPMIQSVALPFSSRGAPPSVALGASDAAIGKVDSATAESGIALALQLAPMVAHTKPKDQHIIDVHAQMFYDLCFWLAVYEELPMLLMSGESGQTIPSVIVQPTIGTKIPINRKQILDEIIAMRLSTPPLVSLQTAVKLLRQAGYDLEENEAELILAEEAQQGGEPGNTGEADAEARRQQENEGVNA